MFDVSGVFDGLLLNLISEGIGILVTVLLVDRIIKEREEKRVKPSKDILYAKMTKQLHRFLILVAPVEIKKELKTVSGLTRYYYGDVPCPISSSFDKADCSMLRGYYRKRELTSLSVFYSGVDQLRSDLETTIGTSAFLMEPFLLNASNELLENLDEVLKIKPEPDSKEVKNEILSYSFALAKSVEKAINLMNTLLTKATKR